MSESNTKKSQSAQLGRNRKRAAISNESAKKARRPQARKVFFESLEDRRVMAFTPGDVFAGSFVSSPYPLFNVTGGGDLSGATPLVANLGASSAGQIAWSRDLNTAYISLYGNGTVVAVSSAGVVTPFASGLSGPTGLILTSSDRLLVAELGSGEVTDITAGGSFAAATPFATGLSGPRNMVQLSDGRILVTEPGSGEVTELGAGGNLSVAVPFANGLGSTTDIVQSSSGAIFVCAFASQKVFNITTGGNFSSATPFATGQSFIGLTFDGSGRFLAASLDSPRDEIFDISAGGNFAAATPFVSNAPNYSADSTLDTVPNYGTLTPTLDGSGNLVITDSNATGKNNSLSISNSGAALVITDATEMFSGTNGIAGAVLSNGGKTLTVPLAAIIGTTVVVNGGGGNDTLTVNVTTALGKIVTFNGGAPAVAPGDKLAVTGGVFATGTLNHTNATDGSVVLGANIINYTGLEPVDIAGTTVTDLVINLPDTDDASDDDTELSILAGSLVVTSLNGEHELDSIALGVFTTVTINARAGDDKITLDSTMSTLTKALTLNGGAGADTFVFETSITAPGTITVTGGTGSDTLDYSAYKVAAVDTSVDVSLTSSVADGYSGNVKVGAATITSFSEVDAVIGNSTKTTDSLTGLDAAATWTIDEGTSSKYVATHTLTFTKFESLKGQSKDDTFEVTSTGAVAYTVDGATGSDTLNLTGIAGAKVELTALNGDGFDGSETTKSLTFKHINSINAGAGSDSLKGLDAVSTWTIDEPISSTYLSTNTLKFTKFETLTGQSKDDTFTVTSTGAVAYTVDGATGSDTLNLTGIAGAKVELTALNGDGFDGSETTKSLTFKQINSINAGAGSDSLKGLDAVSTWTIDEPISSTYLSTNTLKFSKFESLIGQTKDDTFTVTSTGAVAYTVDGATGSDTLNLTGIAGAKVELTALNGDGFDGSETTKSITFKHINSVNGGAGADSLKGLDAVSTWTIDESTNSKYDSTNTLKFTKFEMLIGQSKDDTFTVTDPGAVAYTVDGATGSDTLNLTGIAGAKVELTALNGDGFDGSETTKSLTFKHINSINAGAGSDSLKGLDAVSTWTIDEPISSTYLSTNTLKFTKFETLTGQSKDDTFEVTSTGAVAYTVDGATGSDTLNLTGIAGAKVELTALNGDGFDGSETTKSLTFKQINSINAGAGSDSLKGLDAVSTWTIDEPISSTYLSTNTLKFTKFETLTGQSKDDTFTVTSTGAVAYTVDGATGSDTLNLTGIAGAKVELTALNGDGFDGSETTKSLTFKQINSINAGAGSDSLKGLDAVSTWTIDEPISSTYLSTNTLKFSKFESLIGQTKDDTFTVTSTGAVAYTVDGATGSDTLNLTGLAGAKVELTALNGDGFDGSETTKSITFKHINSVNGGAGADSLKGLDAVSTWTIDESTNSKYDSTNTLKFTKFETLTGQTKDDTFTFTDPGAVAYTVNGATGSDTLNLTGIAGAKVELTALNGDGFDGIELTKSITFKHINNVNGGAGSDSLKGLDTVSTWTIDESTSSTYLSTNTLKFTKFETLTGQTKDDTFTVTDPGAVAYTVNGATGSDTLNLTGIAGAKVELTALNGDGFDGSETTKSLTFKQINSINAGAGSDSLKGLDAVSTWTIDEPVSSTYLSTNTLKFTKFETLTGQTKDDTFTVTSTGAVAYTVDGATGSDTLNLTGITGAKVELTALNGDGFDGSETTKSLTFKQINSINAGAGSDSLKGLDAVSTWTIDEPISSTYLSTNTLKFSKFESLIGQTKDDTFTVTNTGAVAYTVDGATGSDTLNLTGIVGAKVELAALNGDGFDGSETTKSLTFKQINSINAGAGSDSLKGLDAVSTWTIDEPISSTYLSTNTLKFSKFESLIGQSKDDTFTVTSVGAVAYTVDGATGNDTLNLTGIAGSKVELTALNGDGFNGSETTKSLTFKHINNLNGSTASDSLKGLDTVNTWTVDEPAGSKYVSTNTLKFSKFDTLIGRSKNDTFTVLANDPVNELSLIGADGTDKFIVGTTANKLAGLNKMNVEGGANTDDELILNDHGEAGANDYTISPTLFTSTLGKDIGHKTLEKITLNASAGTNAITVFDGAYSPATTIKLVDATGASTLTVDDTADAAANTWTISSTQTVRTAPAPTLTIDYTSDATFTSLTLNAGSGVDGITISSTKATTAVSGGGGNDTINVNKTSHATSVAGDGGNDVFNIANGDFDNIGGTLNVDGGGNVAGDTRTVFSGGSTTGTGKTLNFVAKSTSTNEKGDTLNANDSTQTGLTLYQFNSTSVSRTGAANAVNYKNIELSKLLAGSDDSDIVINIPLAAGTPLPTIVSIDGGNAAKDNRVQVKGNIEANNITIGNVTAVETDRSAIEVTSVTRMWVEGDAGKDVIHNRAKLTPALLDGGSQKTTSATTGAGGAQDDIISSDAVSTSSFSPVLLGNDGADVLHTTNAGASGTTYLVGDYFVNNNVPLIQGSASKTARLQVVTDGAAFGENGDRYVTAHAGAGLKNIALGRLDVAPAGYYTGNFANVTADTLGTTGLTVINWLRGKLALTVSPTGMANLLTQINRQIRLFTRAPGSAAAPAVGNRSYVPGGVPTGSGSFNGGEFVEPGMVEEQVTPQLQNPFEATDVNGDGVITAFDALMVINELNKGGARLMDTSETGEFGINAGDDMPLGFLDVNGDSALSAMDALMVINKLNLGQTTYEMPDMMSWFAEADAAEQAAADWATEQWGDSYGQADSLTDEALLALLAQDDNRDENDEGNDE